jgi:hypothetical protein
MALPVLKLLALFLNYCVPRLAVVVYIFVDHCFPSPQTEFSSRSQRPRTARLADQFSGVLKSWRHEGKSLSRKIFCFIYQQNTDFVAVSQPFHSGVVRCIAPQGKTSALYGFESRVPREFFFLLLYSKIFRKNKIFPFLRSAQQDIFEALSPFYSVFMFLLRPVRFILHLIRKTSVSRNKQRKFA